MARRFPSHWFKRFRLLSRKRRNTAGFTLLELLVAIIIGSLIIIALLSLVVQLTEVNARDAGRSQVQQDMQLALDYISEDLREAVFVYNGECLAGTGTPTNSTNYNQICPGIVNNIPATMNTATRRPVLAFWRVDPLPGDILAECKTRSADIANPPATPAGTPPDPVLTALGRVCISGSSYSLVVYAIDTGADANWQGKARIYRFRLPAFQDSATSVTDVTPGYAPPKEGSFLQWPFVIDDLGNVVNSQNTVAGNPPSPQVLVDFVDDGATTTAVTPSCDEFGANALSPATGASTSFYACVRGGGISNASTTTGLNQDVMVTLVGNTSGLSTFARSQDNTSRLSPIQTRTLVRGIIQKR